MKKFAKIIRVITVAPVFALILVTVLNFTNKAFLGYNFYIVLFALVLLPLLAYPIQDKFKIIKGDKRSSERKLAIIFSVIGYVLGFVSSLVFSSSALDKIVYLTYLLSGSLIYLFTFLIKVNASGHMCGVTGPIAVLIYVFGPWYLFIAIVLLLVIWSSLHLKRHKIVELIIGTIIPIIALIISVLIFI